MTWVFAALAAALVVIYMARPNFRRAVLSAALFFQDDPVVGSTSRIAWSTPRPTPLFFLQLSVVLLLLLAVPHCRGAAVIDRSPRAGVHVLFDRSGSMSTQQNGGTRFDAAVAALSSATTAQQSAIACFRLSAFDLELTTVDLNQGAEAAFEAALAARQGDLQGEMLWYRMIAGGTAPRYVRLRPRASLAALLEGNGEQALPEGVDSLIARQTVEILNLRPTMSLGLGPPASQ